MPDLLACPVSMPLISVVIATYNGVSFLREQLDSIINQTYPHLEIVIVDDASQDNTLTILREYEASHAHVRVFESQVNLGYIKNFERGLRLCNGDLIALSDQDDIWLPEKLSILFREMGDHNLVYCNSELMDKSGKALGIRLSDVKNLQSFWTPLNYVVGNSAPGHAMLIRKAVIEHSLPLPVLFPHDYWVGFVSTLSTSMNYVDQVLVRYRQHADNVFGCIPGQNNKKPKAKPTKSQACNLARQRMKQMYLKCPDELPEKSVFRTIHESYQDFSLSNNIKRMLVFIKYRREITAYKNRSLFRRWLFGMKMFARIL